MEHATDVHHEATDAVLRLVEDFTARRLRARGLELRERLPRPEQAEIRLRLDLDPTRRDGHRIALFAVTRVIDLRRDDGRLSERTRPLGRFPLGRLRNDRQKRGKDNGKQHRQFSRLISNQRTVPRQSVLIIAKITALSATPELAAHSVTSCGDSTKSNPRAHDIIWT